VEESSTCTHTTEYHTTEMSDVARDCTDSRRGDMASRLCVWQTLASM